MNFSKILITAVFSFVVANAFLILLDKAFSASQNPVLSLVIRGVLALILAVVLILKKRELLIYCFILMLPFFRISFNGVSVSLIFIAIITVCYSNDIFQMLKKMDTRKYLFPFILVVAAMTYTTLVAYSGKQAWEKDINIISWFLMFLAFRAYLKTRKELEHLWTCLIILLIFCASISAIQFVFGVNAIKLFVGDYNPNTDMFGYARRIPSIFEEAQAAGQYFGVMTLVFLAHRFFVTKGRRLFQWLSIIAAGCLLLTISRMAIMGTIFGFLFANILIRKGQGLIPVVLLAVFFFAFKGPLYENVLPAPLKERFSGYEQKKSADYRKDLWVSSLPIIVQNPLGVGLGGLNLSFAGSKVGAKFLRLNDTSPITRQHAHFENSYLDLLYSLGWVGLLGLLCLVFVFYSSSIPYAMRPEAEGGAVAFLLGALGIGFISAATSPLFFQTQSVVILLFIVLTIDFLIREIKAKECLSYR